MALFSAADLPYGYQPVAIQCAPDMWEQCGGQSKHGEHNQAFWLTRIVLDCLFGLARKQESHIGKNVKILTFVSILSGKSGQKLHREGAAYSHLLVDKGKYVYRKSSST